MLTRFIRIQLILFTILTFIALIVLGWYYLRLPSVVGHRPVQAVRGSAALGWPVLARPT